MKEHLAEAKDYLFNSLTSLQQEQLLAWVEQLKLCGKPKDNSWIGIDVKLVGGTMKGLPDAAIHLLRHG